MDPEALKKLSEDLDEICRQHSAELQRRVADLASGPLFVVPEGTPSQLRIAATATLEPLKPHDWTQVTGRGDASLPEVSPLLSPMARWLNEGLVPELPKTVAAVEVVPLPPVLPHVPGDVTLPEGPPAALPSIPAANSSESETGGAPDPRPRLYKQSSSLGTAAMRAAAIKNVKMADETEEKGPDYSTEDSFVPPDAILDNSEENKKRGSLASNISNFSHRGRVSFHEADESGDNQDVEEVTEGDDEVRQGRRALVEVKSLEALPPSVIAQAEETGAPKRVRKSQFLAAESRKRVSENQTWPQRIVSSGMYESLSGALILLNCAFVAWQTQSKALEDEYRAENMLELTMEEPVYFNIIQGCFAVIFAIDLCFRIASDRSYFLSCRNKEILWNVLDSFVVAFDLFSLFLEVWVQFGLLRMMRVIRIVRVIKIIRVMKSFSELRMLMYSIISCIKSLVWVIAVLALMLGLFAVLFTSATGSELDDLQKRHDPKNALLLKTFGTLDRSLIELYLAMTGGTDWVVQYEAVFGLPVLYHGFFLIYITFGIYALANVITSIFLENARKSSKTDREHVIQEELQGKAQYLRDIEMIFAEMDADGNGLISRAEFQDTLNDDRVVAYFRSMKLDAREAEQMFNLLDYDGSGEISYQEFVDGCWKLQGEARSLDMKIIQLEVSSLTKAVRNVQELIHQVGLGPAPKKRAPKFNAGTE